MSKTLRWWLFFCISSITMGIAHYFGMFRELYEKDVTKLVSSFHRLVCIYKFVYW